MINTNRDVIPQVLVGRTDGSTWEDITDYVSDLTVKLGDVSALGTGDSGADSVVRTVSFTIKNDEDNSFSPKDRNSSWNQFDGGYEPLLYPMRQIIVRVGIKNPSDSSATFYDIFAGYIDSADPEPSSGLVSVEGRDFAKRMQYAYVEGEYEIASSGSSLAINAIQNIIDDNMSDPPTVYDPDNLPLGVKKRSIKYKSVWDAVQNIITVSGWFMGYRYDSANDEWRLKVIEPPRDKTSADYTFDATYDIYKQDLEVSDDDIRNVCIVSYQDSNGDIHEVSRKDQASIDQYGRRPMELRFLKEINTQSEAEQMADYAIHDLSQIESKTNIDMPIFPQIDLFDTFTLNYPEMSSTTDFYAVDSVKHKISISDNNSTLRTEIQATGKVVGGLNKWFKIETRPGAAEPISSDDVRNYNLISAPENVIFEPTFNGARVSFDEPKVDSISWKYSKVFVSESSGIDINDPATYDFTKRGKVTEFNFGDEMITGETYFIKVVHVGSQDAVSEPSPEYNTTAGYSERNPQEVTWGDIYWGADYINLNWKPTSDKHFEEYVIRLNDYNFGDEATSDTVISRGRQLEYTFKGQDGSKPSNSNYSFYIAGKDKSDNYSAPTEASVSHPGIQKLSFEAQDLQKLVTSLKINLPQAFSQTSQVVNSGNTDAEEKEILGYKLYAIEAKESVDEAKGGATEQVIDYDIGNGNRTVTFDGTPGQRYKLQITAYDSVMESQRSDPLYEYCGYSDEPYIDPTPPATPDNFGVSQDTETNSVSAPSSHSTNVDDDSNVIVEWDKNTEPYFSHYEIKHGTNSDLSSTEAITQQSNEYNATGLAADTTLYFEVVAVSNNDIGLKATWDEVTTDGHGEIVNNIANYVIQYKKSSQAEWQQMGVEHPETEATIRNLEVGSTYDVRMRTVNNQGKRSAWTPVQTVTINSGSKYNKSSAYSFNVSMPTLLKTYVDNTVGSETNLQTLLDNHFYGSVNGDFNGNNIKPNTVQTQAVAVGSQLRNFDLVGIEFEPNYIDSRTCISWSSGYLVRTTDSNESIKGQWTVSSGSYTSLETGKEYYVYAKAHQTNDYLAIEFDTADRTFDDGTYYHFKIGMYDTSQDPAVLATSYGFTYIDGNKITTGTINANDVTISGASGNVVIDGAGIDVTNGDISISGGNIQSADGNSTIDMDNDSMNLGNKFTWDGTNLSVKGAITVTDDSGNVATESYAQQDIPKQPTPPSDPEDGSLWIDTSEVPNQLKKYSSSGGSEILWKKSGDQGDSWKEAVVEFGYYDKLRFRFKRGFADSNDTALDFISVDRDNNSDFTDGFESSLGNWSNTADSSDWVRNSGSTVTSGTGPSSAYEQSYYIYVQGYDDEYVIECDVNDSGAIQFYYHMYGPNMGPLTLEGYNGSSGWYRVGDAFNPNADETKTVIDGGLITTGTIELKGANGNTKSGITADDGGDDSVRIWAGGSYSSRNSAPFRVTQGGDVDIHGDLLISHVDDNQSASLEFGNVQNEDGTTEYGLRIDTPHLDVWPDGNARFGGELNAVTGSFSDGDITLDSTGIDILDGKLTLDNDGVSVYRDDNLVGKLAVSDTGSIRAGAMILNDATGTTRRAAYGVTDSDAGTIELHSKFNTMTFFAEAADGDTYGGRIRLYDNENNEAAKLMGEAPGANGNALLGVSGDGNFTGTVDATTITADTKNFRINHPDPDKEEYYLYHSTVETNTEGDNIYRYEIEVEGGKYEVELPPYFKYLNKNPQIFVTPQDHFGSGYGNIEDNTLSVHTDQDGKYNILVIGTRKDDTAEEQWNGAEVHYIDNGDLDKAYRINEARKTERFNK